MRALYAILLKVTVQQFYRLNAGFFLVVFFLAFGIQQPTSLLISPAFLTGAVVSPWFIVFVLILFGLYYLKCFNFIQKTLRAPENEVLYVGSLLPRLNVLISFGLTYLLVFLPAFAYTILLGFYAFMVHKYAVVVSIMLYNLVLLFFTTIYFYYQLKQTRPAYSEENFINVLEKKLLSWPLWWPLRYLMRQEKVMLGLTKLLSLGVLYAFLVLYPYPQYDLRPTQIGFLTAVAVQAMLVQQIQVYQETALFFLRQLPQAAGYRFIRQGIIFGILLLPEVILLFRYNLQTTTLISLLLLYFFGVSILLVFHALLYLPGTAQEAFLKQVFFLFMGYLLLLLYYPPLYFLSGFSLLLAFLLFRKYYFRYELPLA